MAEFISSVVDYVTELLQMGGLFSGSILIFLESVIPILPLGAFITLNMNAFGFFIGFIVSWIATCCGCYVSYMLFSRLLSIRFQQFILKKDAKRIIKIMKKMKTIPFGQLVVLLALPFTPAFLINIGAGLAGVSQKKFMLSVLIGKVSIIYFWGFIGTSFLESMTDFKTIVIITMMLLVAYLVSKYVSKKTNIE